MAVLCHIRRFIFKKYFWGVKSQPSLSLKGTNFFSREVIYMFLVKHFLNGTKNQPYLTIAQPAKINKSHLDNLIVLTVIYRVFG